MALPERQARIPALIEFFVALIGLGGLKVALGFVAVPEAWVRPLTVIVTAVFIGLPVFALYRAAAHPWNWKLGASLVVVGVTTHAVMQVVVMNVFGAQGLAAALSMALRDVGLFTWCVGLGSLLACLVREKNMIIPVSVFLAGFDVFLVLTPLGPVKRVLEKAPDFVGTVGLNVPVPASTPTGGAPVPFAYIGPADFIFMAMFFIALFRFDMRLRSTAIALAPAILVYLALAFTVGSVPLLVPIGLTVLLVNLPEFHLSTEEWISTALIACIAISFIFWGVSRPAQPAEPLPTGTGAAPPAPAGSPGPALQGSLP